MNRSVGIFKLLSIWREALDNMDCGSFTYPILVQNTGEYSSDASMRDYADDFFYAVKSGVIDNDVYKVVCRGANNGDRFYTKTFKNPKKEEQSEKRSKHYLIAMVSPCNDSLDEYADKLAKEMFASLKD